MLPGTMRRYLLCLWWIACTAALAENEMRTWTSSVGSTLEASLIDFDGSTVELKTADGRTIRLKLSQLSTEDQDFLSEIPEEKGETSIDGIDAEPGTISGPIACEDDPDWHYHLYLPSGFHTGREWPVWFIMSPGGGVGGGPHKRYKMGAEQLGCILAVSAESKNGFWESDKAVEAMAKDVAERLPIADGLLFTTGFSGGSRMAFLLAERNKDVGGVLACGSGGGIYLSEKDFRESKLNRSTYVYSLMGTNDFNRPGSVSSHLAYSDDCRLRFFPGGHAWANEQLVMEGMARVLGETLRKQKAPGVEQHRARFAKNAWSMVEDLKEDQPWEAHHWAELLAAYPDAGAIASRAEELAKSLGSDPRVELGREAEDEIRKFAEKCFGRGSSVSEGERQKKADALAEKYDSLPHAEILRKLGGKG